MADGRAQREWLELVADLLADPSGAFPEQRVAAQLRTTFEARGVAFSFRTPGSGVDQRIWPLDEQFNGYRDEIQEWSRAESPTAHPVLRFYLSTGRYVTQQAHDVPDRFADRRVKGAWIERASGWGAQGNVALPVYFTAHAHRAFVLGRADPFSRDELSLLRVLQRMLVGLDRQSAAFAALGADVDPVRSAAATLLTTRELAVLGLVAEGLTAAAAARRLAVAEGTVHKHLQNVYRKLGVRDRLGAVLRAQQLGVLRSRP